MIQVWTINILVMRITWAGQRKAKIEQKHHRTTSPMHIKIKAAKHPKDEHDFTTPTIKVENPIFGRKYFNTPTIKVYDPMITWYRWGQSTFSSCDHVGGQRKAKMDKSTIGQKPQRIKIKADKKPKRENISILQQSRCTISSLVMWSHDTGVDNQHSRHADHVGGQRKAKMDKSTIGQKPQRIKIKADKTPKRENILILQQSRCTISSLVMWSHDTGVDNQHSRHAVTWVDREKPKMDKSTIGQKPQRIKIKADKTPKRENILILQQSRCTISSLVIWSHDTGVDNQHSRHAITWADREKKKWTKAHIGQKQPKDKNQSGQKPQKRKCFNTPNNQGVRSHLWSCDHMIQVWTIIILVMWIMWADREKPKWTKAP